MNEFYGKLIFCEMYLAFVVSLEPVGNVGSVAGVILSVGTF